MAIPLSTKIGSGMPPENRYSIAVHLPKWSTIDRYLRGDPELLGALKAVYPRLGFSLSVRRVGIFPGCEFSRIIVLTEVI
jgi:hypothetical protein